MGESRYNPKKRTYGKRNFVEILEKITPAVYKDEDIAMSGTGVDLPDQVINSTINIATKINSILPISAIAYSQTSSLNNISGISQYFVKQNELTKVTPYTFETKILNPLGKSLTNFSTSGDFNDYLSGTLLPIIQNDKNCSSLIHNISTVSSLNGSSEPSAVHNYLVDALGWFYFLNTSAGADGNRDWDPSSYVLSSYNTLYTGNSLTTADGVRGLYNLIWRNYGLSGEYATYNTIPTSYLSGTDTYTSGLQQLDKLETMLEVVYSPLYIDAQDYKVETAFNDYMDAGAVLSDKVSKGPHRKLLEALGFGMADVMDQTDNVNLIYDIENVPEEYLEYVAQLIGWKLFGNSSDKWRQQLRNAVEVYKRKGTLDSIQYVVNSLIQNSVFDLSGNVQELWESYIPYLCWYALATASPHFATYADWTPEKAQRAGVLEFSTSSLVGNIKLVVDSILLDMYKAFPDHFIFYGDRFPVYRFAKVNPDGTAGDLYTLIYDKKPLPWHFHPRGTREFRQLMKAAGENGQKLQWDAANTFGPYGPGVYMAGEDHPQGEEPIYLSATGDAYFAYNFREHKNFPIPPFEELKYYKDCTITQDMVAYLIERLKCFGVTESFASDMQSYILSSSVNASSNLGSLNEWLFFDTSSQLPPNYNTILRDITKYTYNVLGLWNGKSSHLFIDYDNTDFDFAKTTLEGDSKTALYEAARIVKRFVPAHAIPRVNLNASASEDMSYSATDWDYASLDHGDNGFSHLQTCSVLAGYECSGVSMGGPPGSHSGRDAFNTFQRDAVDAFADSLISSSTVTTAAPRKALRRRNYRFTLPEDGYYDRGGFNGPTNWDASTMEFGLRGGGEPASGLGELTLGYLYSANAFYPVHDTANLSGVWHQCEDLGSPRTFSGAPTSRTYPYRGLSSSPLLGLGEDRWTNIGNFKYAAWGTPAAGCLNMNETADLDSTIIRVSTTNQAGTSLHTNPNGTFNPINLKSGDKLAIISTAPTANASQRLVFDVTGTATSAANYFNLPVKYAYGDDVAFWTNTSDFADVYTITTEGGQAHHQDRGQLPPIYATMHKLYERQALEMAKNLMLSDPPAYSASSDWYNCAQSLANSGIASGYVGDTFDIYRDFKFGRGLHKTFSDYCYYFDRHDLGRNEMFNTGPNIFAHIFDRGLYNCDFSVEGSAVSTTLSGSFIASSLAIDNAISWNNGSGVFSTCAVNTYSTGAQNLPASGTYIASGLEEMVLPMSGTFTPGKALNAEYRNPKILSGIEFVQTSGAPSGNEFRIFKLDSAFAVKGQDNFLVDNLVIKQKSSGGLPRIRFDLSSYGPRRNYFVPEHTFSLDISALVGEENRLSLGGESMGVWIHTNCSGGWMWSFVPNSSEYVTNGNRLVDGKWIYHREKDLSIREVTQNLSFKHTFPFEERTRNSEWTRCLGNIDTVGSSETNNGSMANLISSDFTNFNIKFDTRNYSIYNNMEYSEVIPIPEEVYKTTDGIHTSATNYYVEVFLLPTADHNKYLLIDDIKLQDVTQREQAGIGTGYGTETKGTPLRPFVKENKLDLDRDEMQSVLKFFTGLMGSGVGVYATNYAARDKALTASIMERDGGGRLNYRLNPLWNVYTKASAPAGSTPITNQLTTLEVIN
jgi:hypothetical protein